MSKLPTLPTSTIDSVLGLLQSKMGGEDESTPKAEPPAKKSKKVKGARDEAQSEMGSTTASSGVNKGGKPVTAEEKMKAKPKLKPAPKADAPKPDEKPPGTNYTWDDIGELMHCFDLTLEEAKQVLTDLHGPEPKNKPSGSGSKTAEPKAKCKAKAKADPNPKGAAKVKKGKADNNAEPAAAEPPAKEKKGKAAAPKPDPKPASVEPEAAPEPVEPPRKRLRRKQTDKVPPLIRTSASWALLGSVLKLWNFHQSLDVFFKRINLELQVEEDGKMTHGEASSNPSLNRCASLKSLGSLEVIQNSVYT